MISQQIVIATKWVDKTCRFKRYPPVTRFHTIFWIEALFYAAYSISTLAVFTWTLQGISMKIFEDDCINDRLEGLIVLSAIFIVLWLDRLNMYEKMIIISQER